jgi:hypothetical protein
MTTVSINREVEVQDQMIEQEVAVDCSYTPAGESYYSKSHYNYLPGDDAKFEWDSTSFMINGRPATADEIKEIENDESLMLLFEEKIRNDYSS